MTSIPLGILHLTTYLQGGAGRAITDLACAQQAAGHAVTVVTSETSRGEFGNYPDYLARLRRAGVRLLTCDSLFARNLELNMRVVAMLDRSVNGGEIDVIHAHAAVPAFIASLYVRRAGRGLPVVQTQHGWGINKTAEQAAFDLDMLGTVDRVITTSHATAALLCDRGARASAMTVIPCGLPARASFDAPFDAVERLEPLRRRGCHLVGCIGSVTSNKNQSLVIEALRALAGEKIAAVFVGEGSDALAAPAREAGVEDRVELCGYQADAASWLPLFDLLVVPSRTEGQGLVVLEAFRAGVPVVASDIPALRELIDHGRAGLLFAADSAHALAGAIREAVAWPAAQRAMVTDAARERFLARFTVERMVARHEALYQELVGVPVRRTRAS
jgi:L-malate glycosyltransferase